MSKPFRDQFEDGLAFAGLLLLLVVLLAATFYTIADTMCHP